MSVKKDDILEKWLRDEISDAEAAEFISKEELETYRQIDNETRSWSTPKDDLIADPREIVSKYEKNRPDGKQRNFWLPLGAAASLILVAVVALFWLKDSDKEVNYMAGDKMMEIQLPDGTSTAILSPGSKISWLVSDWTDTSRSLTAEGLVYLAVKRKGKFHVNTRKGQVRVKGTRFEVGAYEESLSVRCFEGLVEAVVANQSILIGGGEQTLYFDGAWESKTTFEDTQPGWMNHDTFTFTNVPLRVLVSTISTAYQLELDVNNINLDRRYTGTFPMNDIEKALELTFGTMNISYQLEDNQLILGD